jgi:hypothetical protein
MLMTSLLLCRSDSGRLYAFAEPDRDDVPNLDRSSAAWPTHHTGCITTNA